MFDGRKRQGLSLLGVFLFLFISSANFFHMEKTPVEDEKCPACRLERSTCSIEYVYAPLPQIPEFNSYLQIEDNHKYIFIFNTLTASRDPPAF
jgi:hypothetical protein